MIVGQVPSKIEAHYRSKTKILTKWFGKVPNEQVAAINRSAHVLFSADLNPACPNAVLEALGCGLPVAAFATGALAEIVTKESGRIVAYGGDPWKIDPPNQVGLAEAAVNILEDQPAFRNGARIQAEALFDLQDMVAGYLRVFERVSEL